MPRSLACLSLILVPALLCSADLVEAPSGDWPQWLGSERDGVWRETGIAARLPKTMKPKWRTDLGGGYAGPAVAGGQVIVHDRILDQGEKDPANPFAKTNSKGKERVSCFSAEKGKLLWRKEYDCQYQDISYPAGPRASPVIHDGRCYTLGAMGHLQCRDMKDGAIVWQKSLMKEYDVQPSVWGFSAHPLIDGDNLITLVGKAPVVVALDRKTGKEKWKALEAEGGDAGYCPPMIYTFDKQRQLIIWTPEAVNALAPDTGKKLWSHEWSIKAGLSIPTPRQVGNKLFITSFYNGCKLFEVTGGDKASAKVIWQSEASKGKPLGEQPTMTDKLHSIMVTPIVEGEHIYGICSYGELRCLELKTGKRVWSELTASGAGKIPVRWANAFIVKQGGRFLLFNEKGELVIAKLSPKGYEEVSRTKLLEPTYALGGGGKFGPARKVLWSHPAYANKCIFARNDKEIACYSLEASPEPGQ